jgi:hypothetical protein
MNSDDRKNLEFEIRHIFESGANEIRIFNLFLHTIEKIESRAPRVAESVIFGEDKMFCIVQVLKDYVPKRQIELIMPRIGKYINPEIDWKKLREKFFDECTDKKQYPACLPEMKLMPHDTFEWFKNNINGDAKG